jgi:putative hydrolase of the HAD superfamily
MIEAVIFDFDGTILDTETLWYEAFVEVLKGEKVEFPLHIFARGIGTHDEGMFNYILEHVGSVERLESIKQTAYELHRKQAMLLQPREGVVDYLEYAREIGLKIGLATSSPRSWVEPFLTSHQLLHYFETLCTANDVLRIKPDPELYELATARLGIAPGKAIAFEDSLNGAKAAIAAGLKCVIVPNPVTEALPFDQYDLRLNSFTEMSLANVILKIEY